MWVRVRIVFLGQSFGFILYSFFRRNRFQRRSWATYMFRVLMFYSQSSFLGGWLNYLQNQNMADYILEDQRGSREGGISVKEIKQRQPIISKLQTTSMKSKLRLKSYRLENGQYIPQFQQQPYLSPLSRTATSQIGLATHPSTQSDESLSIQSSRDLYPTKPQNPQTQQMFKKKMLEMIEQSQFSFNLQLEEKDRYLRHYMDKYQMLEQRYMEMQSQLAQVTARLRVSAMGEEERRLEIRQKEVEVDRLRRMIQEIRGSGNNMQNGHSQQQNKDSHVKELEETIEEYVQQVASLERELQRKQYTIEQLEKQCQQRMVIKEQQEYREEHSVSTGMAASRMQVKEDECRRLSAELNEVREIFEEVKTHGQMSMLRENQQRQQIRLLQEQNSRLLAQISILQQNRRVLQQRIVSLQQKSNQTIQTTHRSNCPQPQPPSSPLPPPHPQPNQTSQLTRSLLLLQSTTKQKLQLQSRITELTKLLVQRDNDLDSQRDLINVLQEQLKLSSKCRIQSEGSEEQRIEIHEELRKKCVGLEQAVMEERVAWKVAMEKKVSEFNEVIDDKERELQQLHVYVGKLEEIVDIIQQKEGGKMLTQTQTQTEQVKCLIRESSEISLRNAELFKQIAEYACQTDSIQVDEDQSQTIEISSIHGKSRIQTQIQPDSPVNIPEMHKKLSPKSSLSKFQQCKAKSQPRSLGLKLIEYIMLVTMVAFIFFGIVTVSR